ncbi:S9 family peptidase [Aquimarina sp. AU474]|uniref:alpha/beta hydrolase family protein n=1 Tax=Aquimarina sp. AU474 TaxID=2108529 RepID=UPI000D68D2C1|nr:prolyl oligopeptidase family serine peptidase [Aquimarina sp. AU474]
MKRILFLSLFLLLSFGYNFAQQAGYPVKEYLSQINISSVSVSPNGKYIAVITRNDDFDKNKTIKRLWHYEINDQAQVVSKNEIPIYNNTVSRLQWTKDSDFLVFKSKDSLGSDLFKVSSLTPKLITPLFANRATLKKISDFTILDDNTVIYYNTFTPIKTKKDSITLKFPEEKVIRHTVFKSFCFGSEVIDSLFTLPVNVSYFEISPDKSKMIYTNYDRPNFYSSETYANSHTYIIDSKTGKQELQLTNDKIWDDSWWLSNDKVLSLFSGNPESKTYTISDDDLYLTDLKTGTRKRWITSFDGSISSLVEWKNQETIISSNISTSSNFFKYKKGGFEKITDLKGRIMNFTLNRGKNLMAFSMIKNNMFEEVYIARSVKELNNPIKISDFNTNLNAYNTPEIEKITWKNSDGEIIEGVAIWPPGKKRAKNLPLVVDIHGGPWSSRTESITLGGLQYYYYPSLLASKGFVALLPNYRGSTGRGQGFIDAINGGPRTKPTDDIITGVQYMIDQGWVDKNNMIVKGASYGGSLTNSIIGETDIFKAALPSCGVWDEFADVGVGDGDVSEFVRYEGIKSWQNPELYRKESPIYNATKINTPTLITHGEKDVRVPTMNAYSMYYTLKDRGIKTELLIYKGEGHIYRKPSSKLAKVKAELKFIHSYIKL